MTSNKNLIRYFSIFLIAYVILLLPNGIDRIYEKLIQHSGNFIFNRLGNEEVIYLDESMANEKRNDTKLYISRQSLRKSKERYTGATYEIKLRRIGFLATAFLLALIIATPISIRRKLIALITGLAMMIIFVLIKLRIIILHTYMVTPFIGLHLAPEEIIRIDFWDEYFARVNTNSYYVAILIWLAVCFNRSDWQKLIGSMSKINSSFIQPQESNGKDSSARKQKVKTKKK